MMQQLSEAYVTGLLADLEVELPRLQRTLAEAQGRAARVDAELSLLLKRLEESKGALDALRKRSEALAAAVSDKNSRTASLHQEIASLRRRADDIKLEMDRVGPGAIYTRLRRERAKVLVQIEDREAEIATLKSDVEAARTALGQTEEEMVLQKDKHRAGMRELDGLQGQLPSPHAYTRLFEVAAGAAHCRFYLDDDVAAWQRDIRVATGYVVRLHEELRAGKYRLDKNSDVVGGRATASAEAIFGAVAVGDVALAEQLFALATDPNLLFDHIFNVFRVWCLGLYLGGRHTELAALLRRHQWAQGLRGGYVQSFRGLLAGDSRQVAAGVKAVARHEWEVWLDAARVRGGGVINLGGVAIARLAQARGLRARLPWPTLPERLVAAGRQLAQRA